jgi:hypothetical protein
MSSQTIPPARPHVEIGQMLTPPIASAEGMMPVVTPDIRLSGHFRTYMFSSNLRVIYCLCEDHIVVLLTSNRRFVELAYTAEPK